MEISTDKDVWAAGERYEPYVGRWSRQVARAFLLWLELPAGIEWVDIGCGTGALTQTILDQASPRTVTGIDPSAAFIEYARGRVTGANVRFDVGDAQRLPLRQGSADVAVSGLVLNFVPRPDDALSEQLRVLRPGGTAAAYVWDYAEKMQLMRYFWDAAAELDPKAHELDEGRRFPLCAPDPLAQLFEQASLRRVEVRGIEVPTVFRDFDDYWSPFLGGQGPAPGYATSLDEPARAALRELLRSRLPKAADGTIQLTARAWAVRGQKTSS